MSQQGPSRHLQPLLPRGTGKPPPTPSFNLPRKRQTVVAACDECRKRKVKCNAERPACSACARRGLSCVYEGLEDETRSQQMKRQIQEKDVQLQRYRSLFDFLRSKDQPNAEALLQRIRDGSDVEAAARAITDGQLDTSASNSTPPQQKEEAIESLQGNMSFSPRPSDHATARGALPRMSDLDFHLTASHPVAYPKLLPLDVITLGFSVFDKPRNPSLGGPSEELSNPQTVSVASEGHVSRHATQEETNPITPDKVATASCLCDERLQQLDISYWTKVPISNESAATLISLFLQTDQSVIGFLDADLFIGDLVGHWPRFCSAFLVHTILYTACHAHTASDIRAVQLGQASYEASRALFRAERTADDLPTLAAINIFSLGSFYHGNDPLGHELLAAGRQMGQRMNLFNVAPASEAAAKFKQLLPDYIRATSHAAWGTYNWLMIHVLYYHEEPINFPPVLPIPGNYQKQNGEAESPEGGWPPHPLPPYIGRSFAAL